jgi:parallel beta-helix repeat protein
VSDGFRCSLRWIRYAQYQGNITINADGSVSPSTAPIQQTGNNYTLTSDVDGRITVNRNNVILDGNGYTLFSEGYTAFGELSLNEVSNVTVKNFIIPYNNEQTIGISLTDTSNVIVANNTITGFESVQAWNGGSYTGIDVEGGDSNIITGNKLMYNLYGIGFSDTSYNQVVGNNIVGDVNFKFLYSNGIFLVMLQTTQFTTTTSLTVPHRLEFQILLTCGMMVILMAETTGATTRRNIPTLLR